MKNSKRLLITLMAALMLVSVPTEAKASEAKDQAILEENSEIGNAGQLISEKSYKDEDGNEITEKIYVSIEKSAVSGKRSNSAISGKATYRKEQEFFIYTGKTRREKIKCFVEGTFMFKNRRATLLRAYGAVTRRPNGVMVTGSKTFTGTNNAKFRFYAKSNFSKKKEYSVRITAAGDGRVY